MITDTKKNEFLGRLSANLPKGVSLPVVHAIIQHVHPILGVAFAKYKSYAEASATGMRTVERTIPTLHRCGLLRKQTRHDLPSILWFPELMNMEADEALQRAGSLTHHKDENQQGDGVKDAHSSRTSEQAGDKIVAEGEPIAAASSFSQLAWREQRHARAKSTAYENDYEILHLVHSELDALGLTQYDPEALAKAIRATTDKSRSARLKHLDHRGLRKAFLRARERLPKGYDRWIGLVKRWDDSYGQQKARELVDRLVMAVGVRPLGILDELFDHLERQICDHLPKKVRRLEYECTRLETNQYYLPQLRSIKTDEFKEQVYAALADGPKTMKELARMFGKPYGTIASVGRRLRMNGQITTIYRGAQAMWARASSVPPFTPARDAIIAALKTGPKTVPSLARETGKGTSSIKSALQRHLLPNTDVRTQFGTYALAGTEPQYVSKSDAIVAALKRNGPMSFQELVRETGITPMSLPQFLEVLLAKGKIIRTARGVYALPGSAPLFVPTSKAIISVLTKGPMKLGPLVQNVQKLANGNRARGTIRTVLSRLQKEGVVKQDRRGGEYRLVRCVRAVRGRKNTARRSQS